MQQKKQFRIIPKIEIKGENVVKGIQMEGLRVLANPEELASYYYKNGADEIFFTDVVASLYGRNALLNIISKVSKDLFIPMTVGGGLKSLKDIYNVLRAGADKVCINSGAIKNKNFIDEAVKEFGSSTIVVSVEVNLYGNEYYVFYKNGKEKTNLKPNDWIKECVDRGAGEISLFSINKDGSGSGFDFNLLKKIEDNLRVPLLLGGGAGKKEHFDKLLDIDNIDGVTLSSILHFSAMDKIKFKKKANTEGNLNFLSKKQKNKNFEETSILEIKKKLQNKYNIYIN